MGFFTGRVSFLRYQVDGPTPTLFGPEHLELLAQQAIGKQAIAEKDGTEAGWIASDDILDLGFELAKNVVDDTLHFCLRVDTQKLPADLLRSYVRTELQALAAQNPSGKPTVKQKKEAREAAREKLTAEAQDGRFLRRKAYPLLWDRPSNSVLVGSTSGSMLDRVHHLFQDTFGSKLVLRDATYQAAHSKHGGGVAGLRPASFVAANSNVVGWVSDPASVNFLGNEFLLWLWSTLETGTDVIHLADGSDVTAMLVRSLVLDCPREVSGNETIRSDAPTRLPEARRAVQAGKLPRQAGLILVRHDQQYELSVQPELLAVNGAKLPASEERDERLRQEGRVGHVRQLIETIDLLFDAFLERRLTTHWANDLERMRRWLEQEDVQRLAKVG